MSENCRTQKQYDHRLRQLIQNTRDLDLAIRHGVPRSTARDWLKQSRTDVISIDVLDLDAEALQREVLWLRRRVTRLLALLHLVVVAIKVAEFSFDRVRILDGTRKQRLLRAIKRARTHLPLRGVLRLIGMSSTTLVRLLDGSKAYLHAVIDNFSRRVLAWRVNDPFIPAVTAELLIEAGREIEDGKPHVLVDGGVENYNSAVDKLVDSGVLKRILAQTEIRYSNSLIESW